MDGQGHTHTQGANFLTCSNLSFPPSGSNRVVGRHSHFRSVLFVYLIHPNYLICAVSPQIQAQTVTLTQATPAAPAQVQMIQTGTAMAQVVQQKIIQQQVVTAATSPQIQTPPPHSPAQQPAPPSATESLVQQPLPAQQPAKGQSRQGGIKAKTPVKPSGGSG